jgi:uroporphyrinogen-III synthase
MPSVLIVREFDSFSQVLSENGFSVINCPTIKTVTLDNLREFEKRISAIEVYDGVFLTSAHAAKIFREKLREGKNGFSGKVYALGERSFGLLKDEPFDLFFDETANTARELLEKIASEDLKDKRFLYVRGEKSLRVVPDFLKTTASVDEAIVYKTEKITVSIDEINEFSEKFGNGEISCACFFSPSAAESFIEQFGAVNLHQTNIAAIGKTTAEFFERQSLIVDFVSPKARAKDFAVELTNYLRK